MTSVIGKYLSRYKETRNRPVVMDEVDGVEQVVVIPCRNELSTLPATLDDLARNPVTLLEKTLILCVVNNPPAEMCPPDELENNRQTLRLLEDERKQGRLRLGLIDATTLGNELSPREGVGAARKIGADHGAETLFKNGKPEAPLIHLDADTRVDPDYLETVDRFFRKKKRWAGVVGYAHPLDTPEKEAIVRYETFLRYHELGLALAGSPYAFPTIGSTMVSTVRAYATVHGIPRKKAGEDFYFLQKLVKTGPVEHIDGTTVRPSPRVSDRVPFGTGAAVRKQLTASTDGYTVYHPGIYRLLGKWLRLVEDHLPSRTEEVLSSAAGITPTLPHFLLQQRFASAWENIHRNSRTTAQLLSQFHRWFDGFRTLKLIHHLRDTAYPDVDLYEGVFDLFNSLKPQGTPFSRQRLQTSFEERKSLLNYLRQIRRRRQNTV